jgi:hypothetical protein
LWALDRNVPNSEQDVALQNAGLLRRALGSDISNKKRRSLLFQSDSDERPPRQLLGGDERTKKSEGAEQDPDAL